MFMCELMGMSSNHRTSINLSLSVLSERGENPKMHGDGWGVAFYEDNDVRLIKDAGAAKGSDWVKFIKSQRIVSHDVIAHIRKSTVGEVSYKNTHPFVRELSGRIHTFAHNGTFTGVFDHPDYKIKKFKPVGTTDSEYAFCYLMEQMDELWSKHEGIPSLDDRFNLVKDFADGMAKLGPTNFLYSDGDTLFAHGHQRHNPLTDKIEWPGLHYLKLDCGDIEGFEKSSKSGISVKNKNHVITFFASTPLNEGNWIPLQSGELMAVTKGEVYTSRSLD